MIAADVPATRLSNQPATAQPQEMSPLETIMRATWDAAAVVSAPVPRQITPLGVRLLKIAHSYRKENAIRQATEMYFELVDLDPEAPEGLAARDALLEIGEAYENAGELRQARSLYERLL